MRVRLGRPHPDRAWPAPSFRLPGYDLLDVPATPGHRVLLQLERLGAPLGPVLAAPSGTRLLFLVEGGSTAKLVTDLKELGWTADRIDIRPIGMADALADPASLPPLPPLESARWVRPPETDRIPALPPARMLLGSLAYACRHSRPTQATQRKAA